MDCYGFLFVSCFANKGSKIRVATILSLLPHEKWFLANDRWATAKHTVG